MQEQFQVQGMTCNHCVRAVTDAVRRVDAGAKVDIDLASGTVRVEGDAPREHLAQAIRDEGYTVSA